MKTKIQGSSEENKAVRLAASLFGRMGGRAGVGVAKARSAEQARAAANARWAKSHQVSAEIRAALKEGVVE